MAMSITAPEHVSAFMAATTCALMAAAIAMLVQAATPNARRTALGVALSTLALVWLVVMGTGEVLGTDAVRADPGVNIALTGFAALLTIMGVADRVRSAGLVVLAAGVVGTVVHYVYPLMVLFLPELPVATTLYSVIIIAGFAQLVLIASLPLSGARFTTKAERRMPSSPSLVPDAVIGGIYAVVFCALLWRVKAYDEANIGFHLYSAMMSALMAALCAALTARYRRSPAALNIALLALPAGVLATGLLPMVTATEVAVCAAIAGAGVAITRDALISLRFDEPSHSIACLVVPALCGLLAPGVLTPAELAERIQWAGALMLAGVLVGFAWRVICQVTLGLSLSRRASAEGLDTKYAVASASR